MAGKPLKMLSGSCYLPHPDKVATGGEDAHFICEDEQAIGVADGVGSWADVGVNAGLFAQELIANSVKAIREEPKGSYINPRRVLDKAHSNTKAAGSSTVCIIALNYDELNAINVGDSGFIVIRDGSLVFESPSQQHGYNCPYQLQCAGSKEGDLPSSGEVFKVPVAPGDVIVAGSDGLFDNLYNSDITAVVVGATRDKLEPQVTAQKIAALARQQALDKEWQSPFAANALEYGRQIDGGKLDDLTVIVSYISSSSVNVTIMKLKVDLDCEKCYMKVKKLLSKYPQIRDQKYDEKANTLTITVVCCCPEKIRDKLCYKGGGSIKSIEIVPQKKKVTFAIDSNKPKAAEKPKDKPASDKPKDAEKPKPEAEKPKDKPEPTAMPMIIPQMPPPIAVPIGTYYVPPYYEVKPIGQYGPYPHQYGGPQCYDGYYARPVYESYGGGGHCYVGRCDQYLSEENATECTIM